MSRAQSKTMTDDILKLLFIYLSIYLFIYLFILFIVIFPEKIRLDISGELFHIMSSLIFSENNFIINRMLSVTIFGSIIYNQGEVHKRQNFLKAAVHMIISDHSN